MKVPLTDLGPQHAETGEAALAAVAAVAKGGRFILGETVARFERTLAELVGAPHAIGVASGTDALVLALQAAGIAPGDRVITSSVTFAATAEAIVRAGAEPVFCEPDPSTFCLSPAAARARVETMAPAARRRLRGIVPVHLFGRACDMAALGALAEEHRLVVVEDAAQALGGSTGGRALGTHGAAGCFSFFPTKNLGAWGDGGAVVTADEALAARVKSLRQHGIEHGHIVRLGMNSRLDALQAAVLDVKAARLATWTRARVAAAERYRALLVEALPTGSLQDSGADGEHVYHQFVVLTDRREALARHLAARDIETRAYYTRPLHEEPAFQRFAPSEILPASPVAGRLLALPMFYGITEAQQRHVATAVADFFA